MYCGNCGNEIKDGMLFCPVCGARQRAPEAAGPQPQPAPAPAPTPYARGGGAGSAGRAYAGGDEVLYSNKMLTNSTNPLTSPVGRMTVTGSYIQFKSYMIGGNFKVTYAELSAANRTTYAMLNKNALELRLKNGKKYIVTGFMKNDLDRVLELINSML